MYHTTAIWTCYTVAFCNLAAEIFVQPQSVRRREHRLSQLQRDLKDVLRDLANRLEQGVLYSPNVMQSHGTGIVISPPPLRK